MPGKVKVKIISGRNLPVMDRSSDTTDAYVEIKLGNTTYKTDVCRKSLHPKWNSEWYRFELDDAELQDEPLQIRLMDHDTYSANDAIGKVYLDLNPLLLPAASLLLKYEWSGETIRNRESSTNSVMSGWIPVYDTMHGIRGEVNLIVKVELFSDSNKFRQSSCGVQFFCSKTIPHGYYAQTIHGFVEELVVSDDPEYQWIDKIRTPRASNEARQTLFFKLSGELQRKIGLKALDLGGNAVIGYTQCFDLEGESGIVARGIGTAVTLVKLLQQPSAAADVSNVEDYLEFLRFNSSFRLNNPPSPHCFNLFSPSVVQYRPLDTNVKRHEQFTRQLSHFDFRTYSKSDTNVNRMRHSSSLQTLLKQEDMRGSNSRHKLAQRIKNFKFSKKITALKAKPIKSCHSVSELVEKKAATRKKHKFQRTVSDSSAMAELLVRSVFSAANSLGSIGETKAEVLESIANAESDSESSSTSNDEEDDNLSDSAEINTDFDTVSNIVKNVEIIERRLSSKQRKFSAEFYSSNDEENDDYNFVSCLTPITDCESNIVVQDEEIPADAVEFENKLPPVAEPEDFSINHSDENLTRSKNALLFSKLSVNKRSTLSLNETSKERETVLGVPFSSLRKVQGSLADVHETTLICSCSKSPCFVHRESFTKPVKPIEKEMHSSHFIPGILSNLFHKHEPKHEMFKHNKGLVKAALTNVALETVQDILATSHGQEIDAPFPDSSGTKKANIDLNIPSSAPLANTEIDKGISSNNTHASLAPETRNTESVRTESNHHRTESVGTRISRSPCILRRSSDSDLSITPKGGAVSARSVKLLERITNLEEPESRDLWWSELRLEIRSHARALNCNAVLGYSETTSICEDVCVLSASGTAAIVGYHPTEKIKENEVEKDKILKTAELTDSPDKDSLTRALCTICHLPYAGNAVPLRQSTSKCLMCKKKKVPDVLISTIEIPERIPIVGHGCFLQAQICRVLKESRGESNAKEISDGLPFLEYELHRILVSKLKVKGMNAIFGLKVRISIGEKMLAGIATGTAVFLSPLPAPPVPKLVSDRTTDEKKLEKLQKDIYDIVKKNKEIYRLKPLDELLQNTRILSDNEDSEDETAFLDLSSGNKDCCVLEVDDPEDAEVVNLLMEHRPPDGFHVVNTEFVPGLEELEIVKNLQMFTQIWRSKVQTSFSLGNHFQRLLQSVYFKLRRMVPCALCNLQFRFDLPEPDEIQLCVLGMALGLGDVQKLKYKRKVGQTPKRNDDELIFNYEEDQIPENGTVTNSQPQLKYKQKSPQLKFSSTNQRHVPYIERHGVDITPLSYVPGGKIEHYLGNLNFFFIRETQSIREEGGLSGFVHSFVTEVLALVRAHVTALGGNAMVAYFMTECVLNHNLHKNQGQCLINVGGDVVFVSYKETQ